jgi:DNA-binding response OmpR family regulator
MPGKILVVDDDIDIVEAIRVVLESKSYQVIPAHTRKQCIDAVHEQNPDLIILDVMLEKADDGFQICWELKHDANYSSIPVLMLTAVTRKTGFKFSPDTDKEWLPADDYVEKPIQPYALIDRVERLLKRKPAGA